MINGMTSRACPDGGACARSPGSHSTRSKRLPPAAAPESGGSAPGLRAASNLPGDSGQVYSDKPRMSIQVTPPLVLSGHAASFTPY